MLEKIVAELDAEIVQECKEHKQTCDTCRTGDLCLEALSCTSSQRDRHERMSRYRSYIQAELADQEYADKARAKGVIYENHVDGFCSYWQNLRHRLFVVAAHRCRHCGQQGQLEAHHRHYNTLGFEELTDLEALCPSCHKSADRQRAYDSGLETFASKKYGEYWYDYPIECLQEEFDHWLEEQN